LPLFEDLDRRRDIFGNEEDETRNEGELGIINKEAGATPDFILQLRDRGSEDTTAAKVRNGARGVATGFVWYLGTREAQHRRRPSIKKRGKEAGFTSFYL
jgi:hypothetical protein